MNYIWGKKSVLIRDPTFKRDSLTFSDPVSRSGMFSAIATTIERCKTEAVVDVFQVVKALRLQKPGAVANVVSTVSTYTHYVTMCFPPLYCKHILFLFLSDAVQDYF